VHLNSPNSFAHIKTWLSEIRIGACTPRCLGVYPYLSIGIFLIGVALRLIGLDKGIWLDEYYSLKIIFSKDMFATFGLYDNQPPLYLILLRLWATLGTNEETLRVLSVVLGSGTVIVVMLWLKRYSDLASLVSGLICATMPIILHYSQELRSYPLFLFSTALSFFFASRIAANPTKQSEYVGLTVSLSVVAASHLVGISMVTSVFVFLVVSLWDLRQIFSRRFFLAFAIPSLVFLYCVFVWTPWIPDRSNWWVPAFSLEYATSIAKYVFGTLSLSGFVDGIRQNRPTLAALLEYVIPSAIIIFSAGLTLGGIWRRSWPLLAATLFYWFQIIAYSVFVTPVFLPQTVLPGLIPLIGFLGLQLAAIPAKRIRWITVAALIFVSSVFVIRWTTYEAYVPNEPWRQAAQWLESKRQPANLVGFYPWYIEGPIRYYASELSSDNVVLIGLGDNTNAGILEMDKRIVAMKEKGMLPALFLILRNDLSVAKDSASHQNLLKYLESGLGPPAFSKSFGIISISKYELKSK